jgi:uncharacterized membrane protein (UPF0136 family)
MVSSYKVARGLAVAYGLIALIGGLIGFLKAGSMASLIAGGGSGVVLIIAGLLIGSKPKVGLILSLIVALALLGRFVSGALKSGPTAIALVMIIGGLAVLIGSGRALAAKPA